MKLNNIIQNFHTAVVEGVEELPVSAASGLELTERVVRHAAPTLVMSLAAYTFAKKRWPEATKQFRIKYSLFWYMVEVVVVETITMYADHALAEMENAKEWASEDEDIETEPGEISLVTFPEVQ